jgi:hypothetical protein
VSGRGGNPAPLASIVLPVYGQADHIGQVVEEFEAALQTLSIRYEFILVVNGSATRLWKSAGRSPRRIRRCVSFIRR